MNRVIWATAAFVVASTLAAAATVYNTPADLTGTRSLNNGLVASGPAYLNGFSISWEIEKAPGGYEYEYELFGFSGQGAGVSHFLLELSQSCLAAGAYNQLSDPNCLKDAERNEGPVEVLFNAWEAIHFGNSNPGLPGVLYGAKFNTGGSSPVTYTFFSDRAPVWGDFYVRGGNTNYVYSQGITDHNSSNTSWFIARPDTVSSQGAVPEPSSIALICTGLGGLVFRRKLAGRFLR